MPENGANEITLKDIEDFLSSDWAASPAANDEESLPATQPNEDKNSSVPTGENQPVATGTTPIPVTETQAFAHRLKEATIKARNEERESVAKGLGYESYADMQKKHEAEMLKENGFNPEDVSPVVEQLVQKRLAEDPRLKEFEVYRQERVNTWAKQELADLKELTGGKISKLEDVPKDVIEAWKTKGSLKAAYLELKGETLIKEIQTGIASAQNRSTTNHLKTPSGVPAPLTGSNKRPFTPQEREIYKLFNSGVTDEQLSKMLKEE